MRHTDKCNKTLKIMDLHCDTLTECYKRRTGLCRSGLAFSPEKIPKDTRLCQCMAIFMPDGIRGDFAEHYFDAVYGVYKRETAKYRGMIQAVTDPRLIGRSLEQRPVATMLTVEGGSVLNGKIENVKRIYTLGVRMMTLTWNAENELCGGSDTGVGFTPFGYMAVREMERLGMAVDVSHISDRGFYELCAFAKKPFVASHSNSRAICNHPRNMTDEMFGIIVQRGGIVGLNYYDNFIKEGGGSKTIGDLLYHVHHFLDLGGENTLSLGSDYDGAYIPPYLDSVEKHMALFGAMERSGIPPDVVRKIRYGNACRFFERIAGAG